MKRVERWLAASVFMTLLCGLYAVPARADCGSFAGAKPGQAAVYDPAVLVKTYDCLLAAHEPAAFNVRDEDKIKMLEGAGVKNLLSGPGGLPLAERVAMLNDYGLWLYNLQKFDQAQATLELAVQLTPSDAAGWLTLGDSYAGPAPNAPSWADELTLIREALNAYRHYVALTPAPGQRVKDFLALNLTSAATGNVCQFVTDLSNEGRLNEILSSLGNDGYDANDPTPAVDLLGNGTKYYVYILQPESGDPFLPNEEIAVYKQSIDAEISGLEMFDKPSDVDLNPLTASDQTRIGGQLAIFRIKNLYYVLVTQRSDANDGIPKNQFGADDGTENTYVVQPNHGVICHIVPHLKANLALGEGKPLCDKLLRGVAFTRVPQDSSLAQDKINVVPPPESSMLTATSTADLENDGRMQTVAFFSVFCGPMMTLYDPVKRAGIDSRLSDALQDIRGSCAGNEYLITYAGRTYIETDHDGGDSLPGEAAGEGIYEARNEGVFPVCLIHNDFTYAVAK